MTTDDDYLAEIAKISNSRKEGLLPDHVARIQSAENSFALQLLRHIEGSGDLGEQTKARGALAGAYLMAHPAAHVLESANATGTPSARRFEEDARRIAKGFAKQTTEVRRY